ncbi:MAG: hypothetical protein IPK26_19520 [Planctomycetes bacterium]|nr:hypothetical protein [Planctomycetota bacterium]
MNPTLYTYAVYTILSIALTVWVARTLHRNGRVFLVDVFAGRAELADSVNHLLVVGFYLINFGYVSLALKLAHPVDDAVGAVEALSNKVGLVLVVLGVMHFFNLFVFGKIRAHKRYDRARPPLPPTGYLPGAAPAPIAPTPTPGGP